MKRDIETSPYPQSDSEDGPGPLVPKKRKVPAKVKRETSPLAAYDGVFSPGSPSPPAKKAKVTKNASHKNTTWDADRCASLLEMVLVHGAKTADLGAIAAQLGVTKSQVVDQLKPNRSNVRRWAIQAIREKKGGG